MRPPASRAVALYFFVLKQPDETALLADMDTYAEAFTWLQEHYRQLRMRGAKAGAPCYVELFDWTTGASMHWTRVG